ncbi:MAG: hypothetical protein Q9167_007729 [Letrouitia subvulpina]
MNILSKAKEDGPVVVLAIGTQEILDVDWLKAFFDSSKDDVLSQEFVKGVLLQSSGTDIKISLEVEALLRSLGNSWIDKLPATVIVPAGPYFYKNNALWQILRLYDNDLGAFFVSIRPTNEDGNFDVFDIKGMRTSTCNKAYLELYAPAAATALSIIHVIEGGASTLGKTKLGSLLSTEEATESIDFHAAWNPRADGYQSTGGSSSGSAAAVAGYEWIDIGIGTDTNGSIRRPAQRNGVFGLRPSQGVFPQDGMFTVFKTFDVPGIFARDLNKLRAFASKWYEDRLPGGNSEHLPPRIVLPLDLLPEDDTPQKKVVLKFVEDFESFWGVKADQINLSALWARAPPKEAYEQGMHEYLEKVGRDTFLYANYHSAAAFRDKYLEKFGRKPFVSKFVQWRWDVGSKVSREEHEEAM